MNQAFPFSLSGTAVGQYPFILRSLIPVILVAWPRALVASLPAVAVSRSLEDAGRIKGVGYICFCNPGQYQDLTLAIYRVDTAVSQNAPAWFVSLALPCCIVQQACVLKIKGSVTIEN
jgi:hypothetical protein